MDNRKRVPAEYLGKARQFCLKHAQNDDFFNKFGLVFVKKISRSGKMRPERFIDLNRLFKLSPKLLLKPEASNSKHETTFSACFISYRNLTNDDWHAEERERNLVIERFSISTKKVMFEATASVSIHALARWFERAPDTSEGALIENLQALCIATEMLPRHLDARNGGIWIGIPGKFPKTVYDLKVGTNNTAENRQKELPCATVISDSYCIRTYYSPLMADDLVKQYRLCAIET